MRSRPSPRAALLAGALLLAGCDGLRESRPRAVVIGIDGADWRVIDPLVAAGRMPQLAALRERGVSGPIQTLVDFPLSPVIWTSVATGKLPAKHGITWFLVDQPDGTRVPVRSHNRRAKALWNLAAAQGRRAISVGWWATYPAEDVGEGVVVSDALGFHGFGRTAREGSRSVRTRSRARTRPAGCFRRWCRRSRSSARSAWPGSSSPRASASSGAEREPPTSKPRITPKRAMGGRAGAPRPTAPSRSCGAPIRRTRSACAPSRQSLLAAPR